MSAYTSSSLPLFWIFCHQRLEYEAGSWFQDHVIELNENEAPNVACYLKYWHSCLLHSVGLLSMPETPLKAQSGPRYNIEGRRLNYRLLSTIKYSETMCGTTMATFRINSERRATNNATSPLQRNNVAPTVACRQI